MFLGGAAVGALGTSPGYEINAHSKMEQLETDYKSERISRAEYLRRKSQLEKGSIIEQKSRIGSLAYEVKSVKQVVNNLQVIKR